MNHYCDLHIHSRFSRATSPALNPLTLSQWAIIKGIDLIGTGDLTHPVWLKELDKFLTLGDDGFYGLKDNSTPIRFVPTGEVSVIYKQDGRTRKIHLVIIAPDLEAAKKFSLTLGRLGNVESDGRPILGLSARQILEIALHTDPDMQVVPAHIWTPWFSLFGAKSGFDHLEECFGDLSSHITALETGLSSDPAMNRLISALDPYALISSSDAHSPDKLGREATIIQGPLTRDRLWEALKGGPTLVGTVEFFPEEGKYHLDGHLNCGPALTPEETKSLGGLCPVCGKEVTIGVLHRVTELADRQSPLEERLPDHHLIPLAEILGQILGVGPKSKKVAVAFNQLIKDFGSEFKLLLETPLADIEDGAGPLLRLAIQRMRQGEVEALGGYDGQFGTVLALKPEDLAALSGQGRLFDFFTKAKNKPKTKPKVKPASIKSSSSQADPGPADSPLFLSLVRGDMLLDGLDAKQTLAVTSTAQTLAVTAGPGSGKTRVLIHRAAWLLREGLARPEQTLVTTYTRKAALELSERLTAALPFRPESRQVRVGTLHGVAYEILKTEKPGWELVSEEFLGVLTKKAASKAGLRPQAFSSLISYFKNGLRLTPADHNFPKKFLRARDYYQMVLSENQKLDFDDLIFEAGWQSNPYSTVLVDEFQDMSPAQFAFLKRLMTPQAQLTAIGDPDQSIYSFRGAQPEAFQWLQAFPQLDIMELSSNYRSIKHVVEAGEVLMAHPDRPVRQAVRREKGPRLTRATLSTPRREAAWVVGRIKAHLGLLKLGIGSSRDLDAEVMAALSLGDIAVLFRLNAVGDTIAEALDNEGLAWQRSGPNPITAIDELDWTAERINLLSMHAAKGLEFKLVFIVGAEQGLCPFLAPGEEDSPAHQEEEKRLFYVALTRAKDRLYLTRTLKRRLYGKALPGTASPFWDNIPDNLCLNVEPKLKKPPRPPQLSLFDRLID